MTEKTIGADQEGNTPEGEKRSEEYKRKCKSGENGAQTSRQARIQSG